MTPKFIINEDLAWREVEGQILILDAQISESAHELNPMASYIFDLIHQGMDIETIESNLINEYGKDSTSEEIKNDLSQYLKELESLKVILPA